jgi:hypothetical protein
VRAQDATLGAIADGVFHLRHKTMPREIHKRVAPVAHRAQAAEHTADIALGRWKQEKRARERAIDRIHSKWLWPLALAFGGIDAMLHRDLLHRSRTDHRELTHIRTRDLPHIRAKDHAQDKTLARHGARIRAIERATAAAALSAVVLRTLFRRFPWMRCSNFNRLSRLLNCSHFGFLADLLTLGLSFLAVTDPVVIAKAAIRTEDTIDYLIRELAHPSSTATTLTQDAMDILGLG